MSECGVMVYRGSRRHGVGGAHATQRFVPKPMLSVPLPSYWCSTSHRGTESPKADRLFRPTTHATRRVLSFPRRLSNRCLTGQGYGELMIEDNRREPRTQHLILIPPQDRHTVNEIWQWQINSSREVRRDKAAGDLLSTPPTILFA